MTKIRTAVFLSVFTIVSGCFILYLYAGDNRDVTSGQAYAMWQSDPETVVILDVRTRAEYALIGHPPMAHNIPIAFWTPNFDPASRNYRMQANPNFIARVETRFSKDKTILVLCRSGQRSGIAAKQLRDVGFATVRNISDGFEGRRNYDRNGVITGNTSRGGWQNSGAPWTFVLDPELVY